MGSFAPPMLLSGLMVLVLVVLAWEPSPPITGGFSKVDTKEYHSLYAVLEAMTYEQRVKCAQQHANGSRGTGCSMTRWTPLTLV